MPSTWAPIVFWILLIPLLIIMLIVYLRSKRFSRLVFILSVFTYAMTVMYWIDAYRLGRNAIVGLLVASSLLMIFLGWRMHRGEKIKKTKSTRNAKLAAASIILIAIIVAISAMPFGWSVSGAAVPSVRLSDLQPILEEGQPSYPTSFTIYTMTVKNNFIPRQFELPQASVCLYNTEKKSASNANVMWDVGQMPTDFGLFGQVMEVSSGTKSANLKISSNPYYKPIPREAQPVKFEPQIWDTLYLFLNTDREYEYVDCYNFDAVDKSKAIKILITQN